VNTAAAFHNRHNTTRICAGTLNLETTSSGFNKMKQGDNEQKNARSILSSAEKGKGIGANYSKSMMAKSVPSSVKSDLYDEYDGGSNVVSLAQFLEDNNLPKINLIPTLNAKQKKD
jgi:hypothetical protein